MKKHFRGFLGLGGMPMSLDAPLAPAVGGTVALTTLGLAKAFAKPGGWVHRNAGWTGVIVGGIFSILYGLARGTGAGASSGATALAVGGGQQLIQAISNWRLSRVTPTDTPAPTETTTTETTASEANAEDVSDASEGMGFIRARVYRGLGAPKGFLPANGTSPVDVLRQGIAVPAF